ncbi:hypothetical protein Hanom_Chr03g00242931 [Helianthus anomalus]
MKRLNLVEKIKCCVRKKNQQRKGKKCNVASKIVILIIDLKKISRLKVVTLIGFRSVVQVFDFLEKETY